jgi:hypothetical protein
VIGLGGCGAKTISQRTKGALDAARSRGTQLGNPRWAESIEAARKAKRLRVTSYLTHQPEKDLIVSRYLKRQRNLTREALSRFWKRMHTVKRRRRM